MFYVREWDLPLGDNVGERFEQVEGWGQSYFWYCRRCILVYARAQLFPADGTVRINQAVSGICPNCPGDKWTIPGSIEGGCFDPSAPQIVLLYQLSRELDFTTHVQHPHYQE